MEDIDGVLARLGAVGSPRSLADDPAFVARLDTSVAQGAMLGTARSAAIGLVAAALMVAIHIGVAPRNGVSSGSGALLATASGVVL